MKDYLERHNIKRKQATADIDTKIASGIQAELVIIHNSGIRASKNS